MRQTEGLYAPKPSVKKPAARTGISKGINSNSTRRSTSSRSSSSRNSGGSSRSSGGSKRSSGGSSGRSTPVKTSTPKPPVVPSLASYLGTDSVYQQAVSGGKRGLADFISELGRRKGEATTQYNQTLSSMERDRTTQLDALRQEFASRGLINSGLFGEEQGKFQQQFTDQINALGQQQTGLLNDILAQEKNYRRENDLSLEQAKQEALQRRAARYNLT